MIFYILGSVLPIVETAFMLSLQEQKRNKGFEEFFNFLSFHGFCSLIEYLTRIHQLTSFVNKITLYRKNVWNKEKMTCIATTFIHFYVSEYWFKQIGYRLV